MERKPLNKKKYINKRKPDGNKKPEDLKDRIVYRTKETGPQKKADWQLKLMAISDILGLEVDNFNKAVEQRYQELLRKQG